MESKTPPTYTEEYIVDTYDYDIRSLEEIRAILPAAKPSVMEKFLTYVPHFFMIVTDDETTHKRPGNNDESKYKYKNNHLKISKLLEKYVYMYDDVYVTLSSQLGNTYMDIWTKTQHEKEKKDLLKIIEQQKSIMNEYKRATMPSYPHSPSSPTCQIM